MKIQTLVFDKCECNQNDNRNEKKNLENYAKKEPECIVVVCEAKVEDHGWKWKSLVG